jgi:YHS domain-containing protein
MKAGTWQRRISAEIGALAMSAMVIAALVEPVFAYTTRLPELPSVAAIMQLDPQAGLALHGYDPVAYRLEKRAIAGSPAYETAYKGAVWRFVSAANRAAFRDAPEIYEPAFAGFDASAVAEGRAVDADPREFAIIGSRLFLFRSQENRRRFVEDSGRLTMADTQWGDVARNIAR